MKRLKYSVVFTLLMTAFGGLCVHAQTQTGLKSYIPPSPNAMTFMKYGEYPVNVSTGIPQIDIPLYTIAHDDYSYPVSASFHASGRTTAFNFSSLGMNWALQATGSVSREIRGKPDEGCTHYEQPASYYLPQSAHYQELLLQETSRDIDNSQNLLYDPEYDIYSVSVNGLSAKFIIRQSGVFFLTYFPYKVESVTGGFVVTDEKGVKYTFGADAGYGYNESSAGAGITSWFIRSIVTPKGSRLRFKYEGKNTYAGGFGLIGNFSYSDQVVIGDLPQPTGNDAEIPGYLGVKGIKRTNSNGGADYSICYPTEIDFDKGKLLFEYNAANLTLNTCKVTDPSGTVLKKIDFTYQSFIEGTSTELPNNNSRTIKNILFKDPADSVIEKYTFTYYPGQPSGIVEFGRGKDWWGYANGSSTLPSTVPVSSATLVTDLGGPYTQIVGCSGCREASLQPKLGGMIRQIYFPTGGNSEFVYESNLYTDINSNIKEGPGIRVKEIISNDAVGNKIKKSYKYGVGENGAGSLAWKPAGYDFYTIKFQHYVPFDHESSISSPTDWKSYRIRTYTSDPLPDLAAAYRMPVYYTEVAEYTSPVSGAATNGKTVFKYSVPTYAAPFTTLDANVAGVGELYPIGNFTYNEWSSPVLVEKTEYKYVAGGTPVYQPVVSQVNAYENFRTQNVQQVSIYRLYNFPWDDAGVVVNRKAERFLVSEPAPNYAIQANWKVFYPLDKTLISAIKKPTVETVTAYGATGTSITTSTEYKYDNTDHMLPTRVITQRSDGKSTVAYALYPQDYPAGNAFIDNLKSNNILAAPVETATLLNNGSSYTVLAGTATTYKTNNTGLPDKVYRLEAPVDLAQASFKFSNRAAGQLPFSGTAAAYGLDSRYKSQLTYNLFDAANNPLTITPENDIPVSYIWSYNRQYPVAEVKNANYALLETVLGAAALNTFSLNANPTAASVKSFLAPLRSDARLNNAEINTLTYDRLVGITSTQDNRGRETSYEYDTYKRLKLVRDNQSNIVKQMEYSFVNPAYFSVAKSGSYTRNNCGAGFNGSTITYTVPAGTYTSNVSQADADAQATTDLTTNGQAYANANGYCWQYENTAYSKVFVRECGTNLYGTNVTYTVPAGRYTSSVSQQDAQNKAIIDAETNGQEYANTNGQCLTYSEVYKNVAISNTFTKVCSFDDYGSTYYLVVPAAKYISTVSQADADNKAQAELATGQDYVNTNGTCSARTTYNVNGYTSINYDVVITFMNQNFQTRTYTVSPGSGSNINLTVPDNTYTVTFSVPSAPPSFQFRYTINGTTIQGYTATFTNISASGISTMTVTN